MSEELSPKEQTEQDCKLIYALSMQVQRKTDELAASQAALGVVSCELETVKLERDEFRRIAGQFKTTFNHSSFCLLYPCSLCFAYDALTTSRVPPAAPQAPERPPR